MLGEQNARCRKGTKSCSECRRRKVRCIRTSADAPTCRRCEERGSACIAQTYSSDAHATPRWSSRHRISQLESQVATLTRRMREIESSLGYQATHPPTTSIAQSPEGADSDDDSSVSDLLAADQPAHLRSLFQNDWLILDSRQRRGQERDRRERSSELLLDNARQALQQLMPSKDEVSEIMRSGSEWLTMLHALLAQPFTARSEQEMVESYEAMCKPDVDAIQLALWMLMLAVTAQQTPEGSSSSLSWRRQCERQLSLARSISDTVEKTLLAHERLIGTIQGLTMFLHFLRLQIGQGNFQKAWIRLRHAIAIAELMGLPKSYQLSQLSKVPGTDDTERQLCGAQVWEFISAADRLLGMIVNLPPDTTRHPKIPDLSLTVDGVVQPAVYFRRLIDIAGKIHYLDDVNTAQRSSTEVYTSGLELVRELHALASQTPESWWAIDNDRIKADSVVQFLHCYILVRVHMPFTVRQDPREEYVYSRLACMDACESVVQRYLVIRRLLPGGFFLCAMLDLHAFTATVLLLLIAYSSHSAGRFSVHIDKAHVQTKVGQVITLMRERSPGTARSHLSQDGVTALSSLNNLLRDDNNAAPEHELTLKIPLLGKIHVRRNVRAPQMANRDESWSFRDAELVSQKQSQQSLPPPSNAHTSVTTALSVQEDWQWNSLSWSIEDNENFFQDALMADNFDEFAV